MLKDIKSKLNDMGTIKFLCEKAESYALQDQQRKPGAEHFLLAALDLPDGTARLAFSQAGIEPDALKDAIERQYSDALRSIGLKSEALVDSQETAPASIGSGLYEASASGQEIMQDLAATRRDHGPLLGAHVVGVVAGMSNGVAARALRTLGVEPTFLKSTANTIAESRRVQ